MPLENSLFPVVLAGANLDLGEASLTPLPIDITHFAALGCNQRHSFEIGINTVNCSELANKLQKLNPAASPSHIARQCLMLMNSVEEAIELDSAETFTSISADTRLQFQAATDQHAAMTQELEELACSDPREFTPDQIWILVRAIKVQSQVLRMYAGSSAPSIS